MRGQKGIEEFSAFLEGDLAPSASLSERVLARIHSELSPSKRLIFVKLFLFHAVGSFFTLLLCPQFGLSITGKSLVMPHLMEASPALCFFVCGSLWMIVGQSLSYFLLSWDEHRVMGNGEWGVSFSILVLSLLLFGCVGTLRFNEWLLIWGLGALAVVSAFNLRLSWLRRTSSQILRSSNG